MLNIHPAVVHIPIGLLTLYCLLEFLRFKKIMAQSYWFYIKAILVIIGTGGAFMALQSGELVGESYSALLALHSTIATITTAVFAILSLAYIIAWVKRDAGDLVFLKKPLIAKVWNIKVRISDYILKSWVSIPLAFVGFVLLLITGSLGGAIAYGPEVDPIVSFVYHLFF